MIVSFHEKLSVRQQCDLLSVNRTHFYYHPKEVQSDTDLANEIHEIWMEMPFYGYRRITAELQRREVQVNHKRILRIMQEMNIKALYPGPKTSKRNPEHKIYPYLLKNLVITEPDQVWATDITYIKMPLGFVYLVALIDVYSRYIVGWRLCNTLDVGFCLEMLEESLKNGGVPDILNTDQGSQFTSGPWITRVQGAGIKVSMDGKGAWVDNVFIERFWRTIKYEHILLYSFETIRELRRSIGSFIEMYNRRRLHQSLGYKTPAEVYQRHPDGQHGKHVMFSTLPTGSTATITVN